MLEKRELLFAANWTNVLQPLDVTGDEHPDVSPLDVLAVINEINSPVYTIPHSQSLPTDVPDESKRPFLDVDCDQFVSPLDALIIINAINSGIYDPSWEFDTNGGSSGHAGRVVPAACSPKLIEGDSFRTELSAKVVVPATPSAIKLQFESPAFDTRSLGLIRDAFEIALLDAKGNSIIAPIITRGNAIYNATEGIGSLSATGITTNQNEVLIGLNGIQAGTTAHVVVRLINNDGDETSQVRIKRVQLVASDLKANLIMPSSSGDPVGSSAPLLGPSLPSAAPPLPPDPNPSPDAPVIKLATLPASLTFGTRLALSGNVSIKSSPAGQPVNRIQSIFINEHPVEILDAAGNFFDSTSVQAGQNRFTITAIDAAGRSASKTVALMGVDSATLQSDLSRYDDVSASFAGLYGRTQFGDAADLLTVELASKNDGTFSVDAPLLVTVGNISDPTVRLRNADGITPQGNPYVNYTNGISGKSLSPSTATGLKRIEFYNPNQVLFKYDLGFFSKINSAPFIATAPVIEVIVDKAYSYSIQATDENGDSVSYRLAESPKSMTIDSITGKIAWAPKTTDIGNHNIVIEATDGRGGVTAQRFTLAVTTPKPNRPPVFNSTPVVDAFHGEPYVYNAIATDADGDALSYQLVDGVLGLQVDGATGQLKSTLPGAVIFDSAKDFSISNNPVGPWSYGWTQSQGSEFHLFSNGFRDSNGLDVWNDPSIGVLPVLVHNGTATPISTSGVTWQPGQMSVHPGFANERPVVRWTAPASGKAQIGAVFSGLDQATTDVHVLQNSKSIFDGNVVDRRTSATMAPTLIRVIAGDTIDFVVGFGNGTINFDTTSLAAFVQMDLGTVNSIPVTLRVEDGLGGTAQQSFTIDIHNAAGNHDPKIISNPQTTVSFGDTYSDTVVAIDPDADSLIYSLPAGPIGMTIDAKSGKLSWQGFEDQKNITGPSPSNGLRLSSEAIAAGYQLTEFARNIPLAGGIGPLGIAFPVSGGVLITDHGGNVRPFPTDVDGQDASKFSPAQNFGFGRAFDMAQIGSKIYMSQRDNGAVVQINDDGTFKQTIVVGLAQPHGIVANPTNGHLMVSSYNANVVYDIDPVAKTTSVLFNASLDGISISADGSVLYGAAAPSGLDRIYGYSLLAGSVGNIVFDSGVVSGDPDGTALGGGALAGTLFANNNDGTIIAIDLNTKKQTVIASSGTRGDFAKIDPNNGTMLLTQTESVVRLRLPIGSSFTATTNGLKLTPDAISAGLELTEFARKFPVANNLAGPLGIAFSSSGGVLVSDYGGNVRRFPSHADGQDASLFAPSQNYGFEGAIDMAQIGRNIYMTQITSASVVQLDEEGKFVQTIVTGLQRPLGIVANPKNGHLIVASDKDLIYDVDPIAKTSTVLFHASLDGIAISSDGSVLYGASVAGPQGHIIGYSLINGGIGNIVFDSGFVAGGADGIAIGGGEFEGQLFVNTNQGSLVAIDLTTKQQTTIASGGTRGDFVKVDPTNGTLLLTQTDTIARLRLPFGSSFVSDFDVRVQVSDSKGGTDEQDFRLHLNNIHRGEIRGKSIRNPIAPGSEPGLAGYAVFLDQNQNGRLDPFEKSTKTDLSGNYSFKSLIPATYYVTQVTQAGRKLSIPADGNYALNLGAGQILTGIDFTNSESTVAEIRGLKFNDLDGDGVRLLDNSQRSEPGLKDWTIYLDKNTNGVLDANEPSTLTDVNGNYSFANLAPGSYTVTESHTPPGSTGINWVQTAPTNKIYPLTLVAGEVRRHIDFGNQNLAAPLPNQAPKLTSTPTTQIDAGVQYVYQAKATDVDRDRLKFDLPVKPVGMAIDPNSGILVWTPTVDQIGVQTVILRVGDGRGGVDLQSFQVNVNAANIGPIITSKPSGPAVVNLPFQYRIRAQDANDDRITFGLKSRPLGDMSVDSKTGFLTWRPTSADIGTHSIDVTATDPDGDGQGQRFDLIVLASAPNRIPSLNSTPRQQVRLGTSYLYALDAVDPDGDPLTYQLDVSPTGMTIDSAGLVNWTPSNTQFGNNQVKIRVLDGRGGEQSQSFTIVVLTQTENHTPAITSTVPITSTLGQGYRYTVMAYDADGDTIAYSLIKGPQGMSIDTLTGAIRWTPTDDQIGLQEVIVQAMDPLTASTTQRFTITVRGTNLPPAISSVPITVATVARVYTYALRASDPEGSPLSFSLVDRSGDMSIDASGIIRWTPTVGELSVAKVTIRVRDELGATADQSYYIQVSSGGPNLSPLISSQPILAATVGQQYRYQVTATDPEGGAVRFAFLDVPVGMTIDENTGLILWTSSLAGIGRVTVLVGDFDGGETEQSFEVTVRSTNAPPKIDSAPITKVASGVTYRYDVHASDLNLDPLSYTLTSGPTGMAIDPLGRITWTTKSTDIGKQHVKVTVTDDSGAFVFQEYDLDVTLDTEAPKVRIQVSGNPIALDETLELLITATDNTHVKAIDVTVDGKAIALDSRGRASLLMSKVGSLQIVATATDDTGNVGRQTKDVLVIDTTVTDAPEVYVTVPAENSTITAPTDVIGTVKDPTLISWKLEVIASDGTTKQFASGTNQVTNAKLGTFDPTLLQNDSYIIRLTALNRGGLSSSIDTTVNVSGNLKLGNFTLSFTDLSIAVSGIPITVTRTYDTLTAGQDGELGFGWKLAFRDVDLRTSLPKTGDEAGGLFTPFRDGTRVYITLPGGQREGFTFRPKAVSLFDPNQRERDVGPETQSGLGFNQLYFVPSFVPDKGVTNKLTVPRFQLFKQGHEYFQFGGGLPYNPSDPSYGRAVYTLTTKDGAKFRIDGTTNKLTSVVDLSGNSLTFTDDQIASSSGARVKFERDNRGRILSVSDPMQNKVMYVYDDRGDLVKVSDRLNNTTQFIYSIGMPHYLDQVLDPLGNTGVRTEYESNGRLKSIVGANGNRVSVLPIVLGTTEKVTDPLGNSTTYTYDDRGNTVVSVGPDGILTRQTFDDENHVLTETVVLANGTGLITAFTYDSDGNMLTETDPLGNTTRFTYGPFGSRLTETDPLGNVISNAFDSAGRLLSITDALGNLSLFTYDSAGNMLTETADKRTTKSTYDVLGRVIREEDGTGGLSKYTYDGTGNVLTRSRTVPTPTGFHQFVSAYEYDAAGRVTKETDPEGGIIRSEYDTAGNRSAVVDASGLRTEFRYDASRNLIETILPDRTPGDPNDNPRLGAEYDALSQVISQKDALGRITRYVYDAAGRVVQTIYPDATPAKVDDNPRTMTEYDYAGRTTAQVDERGNRTEFSYDAAGRRVSTRDALGRVGTSTYDSVGRQIAFTGPNGRTTRYVYDVASQLVETIYADGSRTRSGYDATGRPISRTDELGRVTTREFGLLGRLAAVIDPLGQRTEYRYDAAGNLSSETDAMSHVTGYEYDDRGYRTATVLAMGQRSSSTYNEAGQATRRTDFAGNVVKFAFDIDGRLSRTDYPDSTSVSVTYSATGLQSTSTDSRGITHYLYDERDRLVSRADPDGSVIAYTYDAAGNRTSVTTPAGTTAYTFDPMNRLATVTDSVGGITLYNYDKIGNLVRTEFSNGIVETRNYDQRDRLTGVETHSRGGIILDQFRYELAANGRRDLVREANGRVVAYTYDASDRLTTEVTTAPGGIIRTITYTYDPSGNRASMTDSAGSTTIYAYDANNQLLSATSGNERTTYTYDANGNTLSKIGTSDNVRYRWDTAGRLVGADTNGDGIDDVTNVYGLDGVRVSQTSGGVETRYLVDAIAENPVVVLEYQLGGHVLASYIYGRNLIAQNRGGVMSFYLRDGLGSTRALADVTGTVTDRFAYDAFGLQVERTGSTSTSFLFAGEQRDTSLGLDYLRARYYNTSIGRFVSRDSYAGEIGDPVTLHRYLYARDNPANYTDPTGKWSVAEALAVVNFRLVGYTTLTSTSLTALTEGGFGFHYNITGGGTLSSAAKAFAEGAWDGAKRGFLGGLILSVSGPAIATAFGGGGVGVVAGGAAGGAASTGGTEFVIQAYNYASGQVEEFNFELVAKTTVAGLLLGGFFLRAGTQSTQQITQWVETGVKNTLEPGRWVMVGGKTRLNHFLSGTLQKGFRFDSAKVRVVDGRYLSYPAGWEVMKGLIGQRMFWAGSLF
ncbi:MAG TPA: putative Ig domain-containing protein [Pirellula sp.]|nr:putative Ig domain-containing protein [Pirellula sp.]